MFSHIINAIRGTVRYKLLVLVLFPIILVMPIVMALAIYWGASFTYDQLYRKVHTDLTVADDIFSRIQEDYLRQLGHLGESYSFRTSLSAKNSKSIQRQLSELKTSAGFSYLHVIDISGNYIFEEVSGHARLSISLFSASQGEEVVAVEVFSVKELSSEDPFLATRNELPLIETPYAKPTQRTDEDRGMMIRAIYPIKSSNGKIIALLDGGVLLNHNFELVDTIRDLVYGPGSLLDDSIGTVTVFLDDVRISTNVPLHPGERALGTRVSNEVRHKVLEKGNVWIDRAFVVNDWYISAYEPIVNEKGERIGMLYTGYLESPYRQSLIRALVVLGLLFVVLIILSTWFAIKGAKSIFKPLEKMTTVINATRTGEAKRIGHVNSQDEIGELARQFDIMLDLLQQRSQQIQDWADQLEYKVSERTEELERKNADLRRTIRVLNETRQQLVMAEKLAALGELTAGVAHEINNPTQVMLGNLDMIIDELGTSIAPVQQDVDLVIKQIYRIQEIINNLLQYAHPDQYSRYITDINVNNFVRDTLKLINYLHNDYQFKIKLDLSATHSIRINQHELQQVVVNLIVNAVHALHEHDGEITILTRDWANKGVIISIADNGSGISESQLERIFNPFYTTKEQGEGTGLGLSVSYSLIRRYGGNITVNSTPGIGSEFKIWLLSKPEMVEDETTIREQLNATKMDAELRIM